MTGATLLIERSPGETRAALLRGRQVWQVDHFRDHEPATLGGVYRGRVRRLDPAMNAAFIDIGLGDDGFLRARDAVEADKTARRARIADVVHEGQAVAVHVVAEGFGGKGPRLVRLPEAEVAAAEQVPACLAPPLSPVERALATSVGDNVTRVVCNDGGVRAAARRWLDAAEVDEDVQLVRENGPLFAEHGVEDAIAEALALRLAVGEGAELVFDQTESLCAIDVNSARQIGKAGRGARDVNLAVAPEIARQLRLRAIGGAIVVDALKMARSDDKKAVLDALRRHLRGDPAACHVLGISNLGLVEITRTRLGPSLAERLLEPARAPQLTAATAACGALRALVAAARHQPAGGYVLRTAPAVADALSGPLAGAWQEALTRAGAVSLDAQPGWPRDKWDVAPVIAPRRATAES